MGYQLFSNIFCNHSFINFFSREEMDVQEPDELIPESDEVGDSAGGDLQVEEPSQADLQDEEPIASNFYWNTSWKLHLASPQVIESTIEEVAVETVTIVESKPPKLDKSADEELDYEEDENRVCLQIGYSKKI